MSIETARVVALRSPSSSSAAAWRPCDPRPPTRSGRTHGRRDDRQVAVAVAVADLIDADHPKPVEPAPIEALGGRRGRLSVRRSARRRRDHRATPRFEPAPPCRHPESSMSRSVECRVAPTPSSPPDRCSLKPDDHDQAARAAESCSARPLRFQKSPSGPPLPRRGRRVAGLTQPPLAVK